MVSDDRFSFYPVWLSSLGKFKTEEKFQESRSIEAQITQFKNTSTVVKVDCGANLPCLGHSPSVLLDL